MKDITNNHMQYREATVAGKVFLRDATVQRVVNKELGDVLGVARVDAMNAAKTNLVSLAHDVPLERFTIQYKIHQGAIEAEILLGATAKVPPISQAVSAISTALNSVLCQVEEIEKDSLGAYPSLRIGDIQIKNVRTTSTL